MQNLSLQVFDEIISGTATTWYTPTHLHVALGRPDALVIQAATTLVSGTSPILRVRVEHSADGRTFVARMATPEINDVAIANDGLYAGNTFFGSLPMGYVRLAITLGGTTPKSRVIIGVTGRDY